MAKSIASTFTASPSEVCLGHTTLSGCNAWFMCAVGKPKTNKSKNNWDPGIISRPFSFWAPPHHDAASRWTPNKFTEENTTQGYIRLLEWQEIWWHKSQYYPNSVHLVISSKFIGSHRYMFRFHPKIKIIRNILIFQISFQIGSNRRYCV